MLSCLANIQKRPTRITVSPVIEIPDENLSDEFLRGYHARDAQLLGQKRRARIAPIIVAALILAIAILGATFLYVGEKHRALCIRDSYAGCSMLPWSGQPTPSSGWGGSAAVP
jgi:hypothetical protein